MGEEENVFCSFFLAKKRRNCKMRVKRGAVYCAEHLTAEAADRGTESVAEAVLQEDRRIPCPLDPAHSVYESKLKAHLKKCNAASPEIPPLYYSKDLNILPIEEGEEANANARRPSVTEMVERIERASKIYPVICERLKVSDKDFSINETEKHRLQQKALSDLILEKVSSSKNRYEKVVIVEFGAGKGGLSSYLWESHFQSRASDIQCEFLLIDRSNSRCKKDAKMRHTGAAVKRVFIDIKDLDLSRLFDGYDREKTYFLWVSKHLCGAATCLTINALKNLSYKLEGTFCVALCCHQCCSPKSYPNPEFLLETGLIVAGESFEKSFKTLLSVTSWAVCGFREFGNEVERDSKRSRIENPAEAEDDEIIYTSEFKESIGRKAKRLIDYGRFLRLKESFGECELKHYIEEEVTLENAVLIGHMKHLS